MNDLDFIRANFDIPLCDCFATGFLSETQRCPRHHFSKWQWYHDGLGHWRCSPRNRRPETWWQKRIGKGKKKEKGKGKGKGKAYESRSPSSKAQRSSGAHAKSHTTAPLIQSYPLTSPRLAFTTDCEMYEYIACFMEEWKKQVSITPWTPDFEAPDSISRELEPQTEEWEHEANIAPWTPNPEAFDFVPRGGFEGKEYNEPEVTMGPEDEKADCGSAQVAYGEEICRQYEMDLYMDYMRHLWAPAVYCHHP